MSIDATLQTLLRELMESFDDSIDTSSGSGFDTQVAAPFLTRIGGSPLDVDIETFLVERLEEEIEDIDVGPTSGIRDLIIRPVTVMLEPFRREMAAIKNSQSLNDSDQMTREEVDALLGNFFIALTSGERAAGIVRIFFTSPKSVTVTPTTQFSTGNALNFFPTVTQFISSTSMSFNQDGSLYYFDVNVEAENAGEAYNVAAGDINSVVSLAGVARVANRFAFDDADDEETKDEGIARARESITVRNLATARGIGVVVPSTFAFAETLQVIGFGDDEMLRDIINGPADISGIPGGIVGTDPPTLGSGEQIHIGGKTDVYVYQPDLIDETLDIQDITDVGRRIFASVHGFTLPGPPTTTFRDDRGHFLLRNILPGDFLRTGENEIEILSVASDELVLDSVLDGSLFGQTYEIVRFDSADEFIDIALYDLVALDSDGEPVIDDDGDPVQPIPGDVNKAQLLDSSGDPVKKTDNRSDANVSLPMVYVETVEFLSTLTLEPTGILLPMSEVLRVEAVEDFTGGTPSVEATGTVRVFFRDACSAWGKLSGVSFTVASQVYELVTEITGSAEVLSGPGDVLSLVGNFTATIFPGYRITWGGTVWTVLEVGTFGTHTPLTLRRLDPTVENFAGTLPAAAFVAHVGVLEATMPQDASSNLYYLDMDVVSIFVGIGGNIDAATVLDSSNVQSEGWVLRNTNNVLAFSTEELPILRISNFVNDDTNLAEISTAYAVRATYKYASQLPEIQDFVRDDDNRVVGEDILVKHFRPALVRVSITTDLDSDTAEGVISDYIDALDPEDELETSDLVKELYDAGATHVELPFTIVSLEHAADRTWGVTTDQDSVGSDRIQHFLADGDFVDVTQE